MKVWFVVIFVDKIRVIDCEFGVRYEEERN